MCADSYVVRACVVLMVCCAGTRDSQAVMLLGSDGWVTHRENGVTYVLDVTRCMFSSGVDTHTHTHTHTTTHSRARDRHGSAWYMYGVCMLHVCASRQCD